MEDGFFAVNDQGVPRIVTALETHDSISLGSQQIDDLAFAFITPLGA